ncbi:MAG: potassium channel family protein [Pseudomonadota bacterium]
MFLQLLVGALLIVATVFIHALALEGIMRAILHFKLEWEARWRSLVFSLTILAIFFAHVVEVWVWGVFYYFIEEVPNLETALYFSTVSFTTVGYGDVTLSEDWRLLGSFEAANGMMLFGWSTAFLFEVIRRTYKQLGVGRERGGAAPGANSA